MTLKDLWRNMHLINSRRVVGESVKYYTADTDTACSFTESDTIYSMYDGSSNFKEWVKNFLAFRVGLFGSAIGYDATSEEFFIKQAKDFDLSKKRVFCGFSRGGAIALPVVLRYIRLCEANRIVPQVKIITFSAPKTGGRKFRQLLEFYCQKYDIEMIRVTMNGDYVPAIVPWWRGHFQTLRIKLKNKERGEKNKHTKLDKYLPDMEIEWN